MPFTSVTPKYPGFATIESFLYSVARAPVGNLHVLMSSLEQIWGKIGKFPSEGFPPVPESWSAEKPVMLEPSVEKPPVFSPSTSATAGVQS